MNNCGKLHLSEVKTLSGRHYSFIIDVLESHGIIIKEISTHALCKAGDNYSSEMFSVKIKTISQEEHNLIVKVSTMNNSLEEMAEFNNVIFKNEVTMYTKVLTEFEQLQIDYAKGDDIFRSANFYGGSWEMRNEIVLLDDLSVYGYAMYDKLMPLAHNKIKMALKNLAQFHSYSYALKIKYPEKYSELCGSLEDTNSYNDLNEQENGFWNLGFHFGESFDNIKYKNVVIDSFGTHIHTMQALSANKKNSKYYVIIHGDCWANNILFKLKDQPPQDCILIDYQLSKESSPVEDVLHLLFNSTDYETRSQYWHHWLDVYYLELQENLFNFNLDMNTYPKAKFLSDIKRYAKAHLGTAIIKLCFILRESDESEFIKDALSGSSDMEALIKTLSTSEITDKTVLRIRKRIEGLIDSCKEFGYLKRKKRRKPLKKKKKIRLLQKKYIADFKSD